MTDNDRPVFAKLMKVLGETFGNTVPSKEKMEIYFRALSDLSIEQVDAAVLNLVNTRMITSTFPVPAELREGASGGQATALLALDKAEKAAERIGAYKAVIFDDPVIHMVVSAMGGWPKFCRPDAYGEDQDPHWQRKEFTSLYETFAKNPRMDCPKLLVGIGDISYQRGDETITVPPVVIGDRARALAWTGKKQDQIEASPVDSIVSAMANSFKM